MSRGAEEKRGGGAEEKSREQVGRDKTIVNNSSSRVGSSYLKNRYGAISPENVHSFLRKMMNIHFPPEEHRDVPPEGHRDGVRAGTARPFMCCASFASPSPCPLRGPSAGTARGRCRLAATLRMEASIIFCHFYFVGGFTPTPPLQNSRRTENSISELRK